MCLLELCGKSFWVLSGSQTDDYCGGSQDQEVPLVAISDWKSLMLISWEVTSSDKERQVVAMI